MTSEVPDDEAEIDSICFCTIKNGYFFMLEVKYCMCGICKARLNEITKKNQQSNTL